MKRLKDVLAQPDTVLFIGSGISSWSGLPSWTSLIENLAAFLDLNGRRSDAVRSELRRGDLLQAASYGFHKLSRFEIGEFIRAECKYGSAIPHEIHRLIVSLGPTCFVTTNYDTLIEDALRQWRKEKFFGSAVTNRHLTEIAEIVQARAADFIFKPHGDAGDASSVILTREQYRSLAPGGDRQAALDAVRMLMASRPIVYLGFGLRDPDFLLLRDSLANTYKGGTRDHYALIADADETEESYWREFYGIHLISYQTRMAESGARNHTALIELLQSLQPSGPTTTLNTDAELLLALARYAARLALRERVEPELRIAVHNVTKRQDSLWRVDPFDGRSAHDVIVDGPSRCGIIGAPGAGKSYAMHKAAAVLASSLHSACLADGPVDLPVVPLFADLKLYAGDLSALLSASLPPTLSLLTLASRCRVKLFLDSFNEMPRGHLEDKSYLKDFHAFLEKFPACDLVIGSRTPDGLDGLGLRIYELDQIDAEVVTTKLSQLRIGVPRRFKREMIGLLGKPFFFSLVASQQIRLPANARPRDVYDSYFSSVEEAHAELSGGTDWSLIDLLSHFAFEGISLGLEAQPLSSLLFAFRTRAGLGEVEALALANWLVSKTVLVPYSGSRVAFFHQSATEYLAARELARRFLTDGRVISDVLQLYRWDQAIFLALSFLPHGRATDFLSAIMRADFRLAVVAAKYAEFSRDEIVESVLKEALRRSRDERAGTGIPNWEWAVRSQLPVSAVHEETLRALLLIGGIVGCAAATKLIELRGAKIRNELLELMYQRKNDYNFCSGTGTELAVFADDEDILKVHLLLLNLAREVAVDAEENGSAFIRGCAHLLGGLNPEEVSAYMLDPAQHTPVWTVAEFLSDLAQDNHNSAGLAVACDLIQRDVPAAATSLYFAAEFARAPLDWACVKEAHVRRLIAWLRDGETIGWHAGALKHIARQRADFAQLFLALASGTTLIDSILTSFVRGNEAAVFDFLSDVALGRISGEQSWGVLQHLDLDWSGKGDLFISLLLSDIGELSKILLDIAVRPKLPFESLEFGNATRWLDFLPKSQLGRSPHAVFYFDRFGTLVGGLGSRALHEEFIRELNASSVHRKFIADYVLPHIGFATTDDLSSDTVSYLLAELRDTRVVLQWFPRSALLSTATESFVQQHLLPLLPSATGVFRVNLKQLLVSIGERHGRRYVES